MQTVYQDLITWFPDFWLRFSSRLESFPSNQYLFARSFQSIPDCRSTTDKIRQADSSPETCSVLFFPNIFRQFVPFTLSLAFCFFLPSAYKTLVKQLHGHIFISEFLEYIFSCSECAHLQLFSIISTFWYTIFYEPPEIYE